MHRIILTTWFALTFVTLIGCAGAKVRDLAEKKGLTIGAAVAVGDLFRERHTQIIRENCAIIVAENCMKWANLHPNASFWNWSDTDNLVAFARTNGMDVKWHTLFWHNQNSSFLSSLKTKEQALSVMDEYVTTVMSRYRGQIRDYDVVNEMFNENGTLRDTIWLRTIGPKYIEYALRAAQRADPEAKLYLNEYNNEAAGHPKADAMYEFVKRLKARGVPLDGVGMQMHLDATLPFDVNAVRRNVRRYAELGLTVSFSEVDVRIPLNGKELWEERQKEIYCALMQLAIEEPAVSSFIVWGITDEQSWIPATFSGYGSALLYDANMKPKRVYSALVYLLK